MLLHIGLLVLLMDASDELEEDVVELFSLMHRSLDDTKLVCCFARSFTIIGEALLSGIHILLGVSRWTFA